MTLFEQAISFAVAMGRHAVSGWRYGTPEEIGDRFTICLACDQYNGELCLACGCHCNSQSKLLNKLALALERCPLGKWESVPRQQPAAEPGTSVAKHYRID